MLQYDGIYEILCKWGKVYIGWDESGTTHKDARAQEEVS